MTRFSCAALAMLGTLSAFADDTNPDGDAELSKALYATYRDLAAGYEFKPADGEQPLRLEPTPLMNWSLSDGWQGSVFLWTRDAKPQVIGCVGSGPASDDRQGYFHEFHTLTDNALAPVELDAERDWTWAPEQTGVAFREFPDAPAPARTATGRLVQMRGLARQLRVTMLDGDEPWVLRVLPQPLHRYAGRDKPETDGAVFAWLWSKGTDPEFLLVVEPRKTDNGLKWHYAPARFTWRELKAELNGETVWQVPRYTEQWQNLKLKEPYVTVPTKKVPVAEIRAAAH